MDNFICSVIAGLIVLIFEYTFFVSKSPDARLSDQFTPTTLRTQINQIQILHEVECFNCHSKNKPDNSFCSRCGKELYELCPKCSYRKPLIEPYCGQCGKNPSELRLIDRQAQRIYNKTILIGICVLIIIIRTITLPPTPNWIGVLSILPVIVGSYGLGRETLEDAIGIYKSNVWSYRYDWADTTTLKITRSLYINALILVTFPLLIGYGSYIIFGWF